MTTEPADNRLTVLTMVRLPIVLALVALGTKAVTETDVWGHLKFGLDFLETHSLPAVDPYSFTSAQPWVNHEWISDLVFAVAYTIGGLPILTFVRALVVIAFLAVLERGLRDTPWPWRDLMLVVAILLAKPLLNAVRPQIFSLVFYAVTLVGLSRDVSWLPALFVLWANVHGGWMIGLGAVGAKAFGAPSKRGFIRLTLCTLATLVNPYGVHLWTSLAEAILRGWDDVLEWQPVWRLDVGYGDAVSWGAVLLMVLWALYRRPGVSFWEWGWTLVVAIAAARARRHVPFFAVTGLLLVFSHVRLKAITLPSPRLTAPAAAILCVPLLMASIVTATVLWPTATCLPAIEPPVRPEVSAVRFIRSADVRGKVLMWFDWGLYAIWHLNDHIKVSIDNRRETVYSAEIVSDHRRFYFGEDPSYPERVGADYVWIPPTLPAAGQLAARGWHEIYRGPRSIIFGRESRPLAVGEPPVPACFPNP